MVRVPKMSFLKEGAPSRQIVTFPFLRYAKVGIFLLGPTPDAPLPERQAGLLSATFYSPAHVAKALRPSSSSLALPVAKDVFEKRAR